MQVGISEKSLSGKHGPCPLCDSKDNFRFDNKNGAGTWICTCGSGYGTGLVMQYKGLDFQEASSLIDRIIDNVQIKADAPKKELTPDQQRDILRRTYAETIEVQPGDLVHKYLATRGVDELIYPKALRFAPNLRDGMGGIRPAMVAMVGVPGRNKFVSMHKTFLKPDGSGKAEIGQKARQNMPGSLPDGSCVMLGEYTEGGPLGIAEGIETALSASALHRMPVWSALNSSMLKKWVPPEGCAEVAIFGDNDRKFGGQAAAYHLAHKLQCKGINVTVHIPNRVGSDFNDMHMESA